MKIDQEYLKGLLIAFEENPTPQTDIKELKIAGYDWHTEKFLFHMRLLDDEGLISRIDGKPGFGYYASSDEPGYVVVPLRLTSQGHTFIDALRKKEVWNAIKENFKEASISTLVEASKGLAEGFIKQKVKQLTGFDPD